MFQGGNQPHILPNNYIRVWQEEINDWYLPLNDYLRRPNPYIPEGTPGHERWQDSIPEVVWETTLHASGSQHLVTVDAVAVGLFYNQDLLEETGIATDFATATSLWADWASMINDMQTLSEADYEPLAEREGISDQVVDFLMYLTAQPQWSEVVTDAPRAVPTLIGLDVPEALEPLTAFLELPIRAFKDQDALQP